MRGPAALLVTLAGAAFLVSLSGTSLAPFLVAMTSEFGVSFGMVTHLFSFQAIAWGVCAPFAGRLSDRVGRRPLVIAALGLLALSRFGLAASEGFLAAVFWQVVSGVCGGSFTSTALAAVSEYVPAERRGRGLAWIVTGQSVSLLVGVPLMTLLAGFVGWRGAVTAHGIAAIAALLALFALMPRLPRHAAAAGTPTPSLRGSLDRRLAKLLAAGVLERVTFAAIAIYLASFLGTSYGLPFAELSLGLAIIASGNFIGNALGARLADQRPDRVRTFAVALVATGTLNLPLMLFAPGYALSVMLGFAVMLINALGRPSYLATLSEVPAQVRGSMMGLNVMLASLSWLGAALIGGLVDSYGYGVVAIFSAATAGAGAAIAFAIGGSRARPGS